MQSSICCINSMTCSMAVGAGALTRLWRAWSATATGIGRISEDGYAAGYQLNRLSCRTERSQVASRRDCRGDAVSVGSRVRADVVTAGELCIKEMTCAVEQAFQLGAIGNSLRRFEHSYGRRRFLRVKPLLAAVVQRCGQEFLYPVRSAVFQNLTHDVGPEVTITFELCLIEKLVRRCLMG